MCSSCYGNDIKTCIESGGECAMMAFFSSYVKGGAIIPQRQQGNINLCTNTLHDASGLGSDVVSNISSCLCFSPAADRVNATSEA